MKDLIDIIPEVKDQITGDVIRRYRDAYKLSQNKLAELVGISQNNLSAIENGKRSIGIETATRFCAIFPINLEDLIYPNGIENSVTFIETQKKSIGTYYEFITGLKSKKGPESQPINNHVINKLKPSSISLRPILPYLPLSIN